MPPKGSKKSTVPSTPKVAVPSTPQVDSGDEDQEPSTPATVKKTPRKRAPAKVFNQLASAPGAAVLVDVTYENETPLSKQITTKGGGFGQVVKLHAPQPFELIASYMLEDGQQAIIVKPSSPFPFLKLPKEFRTKFLTYLLAPKHNVKKNKIEFTSDKSSNVKAKDYSKEFKHRAAIMFLNKAVYEEARAILYGFKLRFDTTITLLNFLSQASDGVRQAMSSVVITSYSKLTAMPAMNLLAECRNLQKVVIIGGVGVKSEPHKAAKVFFGEAGRLLQAIVGQNGGDKDAALSVVSFGSKCLTIKDEDGEEEAWDEDQTEEFADAIRNKLK